MQIKPYQIKPYQIKIALFLAILVLVFYFSLIFIGDSGLQDLTAIKLELKKINAKNETIRQENVDLYRKIERIKTDPVYMENIAREELKMIGKDQIVFKFDNAENAKKEAPPEKAEPMPPEKTESIPPKKAEPSSPENAPTAPKENNPAPEDSPNAPKD